MSERAGGGVQTNVIIWVDHSSPENRFHVENIDFTCKGIDCSRNSETIDPEEVDLQLEAQKQNDDKLGWDDADGGDDEDIATRCDDGLQVITASGQEVERNGNKWRHREWGLVLCFRE